MSSSDSSTPNADWHDDTLKETWAANSLSEVETIQKRVQDRNENSQSNTKVVLAILQQLKRLTFQDPKSAQGFIVGELTEWCLKPSGDELVISTMQAHEFRELLADWIYQYSFDDFHAIRAEAISKVVTALKSKPISEQIWTASSIGYRTQEIVDTLRSIQDGSNEQLSDAAVSVRSMLGVPSDEQDSFVESVSKRISQKLTRGSIVAVQELCGPAYTRLAIEMTRAAEKFGDQDIEFSIALSTAARVAERSPDNSTLHSELWEIFSQHWQTIRMSPLYANSCDVEATVREHVDRLLSEFQDKDPGTGDYITLSRLAELTKPRQLEAWGNPRPEPLTSLLRKLSTFDTKIEGRYATTSLSLKKEAWETALTAMISEIDEWIDEAILNETNPDAANSVAKIIACVRPRNLSQRFLDRIRDVPVENERTRHRGMAEIARSWGDEACLEAVLEFGLTHDGHVLLSSVNAITDCALTQIWAGNYKAIERVLAKTTVESEKRHQDAAIAAFCDLASEGVVNQTDLLRLWDFATDDQLNEYSHNRAMEAIGLSEVEVSEKNLELLIELAKKEDELSWRACEILIKRKLVDVFDHEWLVKKLQIAKSDRVVELDNKDEIPVWQAFLIGLLFRQNPTLFSPAVATMVGEYSDKSLYQLLHSLEYVGNECPEDVAMAIVHRIKKENSRARTNVALFKTLRQISERKLVTIAKALDWRNWLPVARTSLCEQIGFVAFENTDLRNECVTSLIEFMRDASFQVRRSAYRATGKSQTSRLFAQCEIWSRTSDIEFRKRGCEAVAWLPRESWPDERIIEFGFGWDEEPSVRAAFKGAIEQRRRVELSRRYVDLIIRECRSENGVLKTYKYARALEKIGDDESAECLQRFFDFERVEKPFCSHVGHYLEKTIKAIRKSFKSESDKWPEPWAHESGIVEEIKGQLIIEGQEPFDAFFTLRCQHKKGPSDLGSWSATAIVEGAPAFIGLSLPDAPVVLEIENREDSMAHVFSLGWRDNSTKAVFTLGGGLTEYPSGKSFALRSKNDLHSQVSKLLKGSAVQLTSDLSDPLEELIAQSIENSELDFFESRPSMDKKGNLKETCQIAAIVLSEIAEWIQADSQSEVLLWKIANIVLGRNSLMLRLSPQEVNALQKLSSDSDAAAPDQLLFWLIERVDETEFFKSKSAQIERD